MGMSESYNNLASSKWLFASSKMMQRSGHDKLLSKGTNMCSAQNKRPDSSLSVRSINFIKIRKKSDQGMR